MTVHVITILMISIGPIGVRTMVDSGGVDDHRGPISNIEVPGFKHVIPKLSVLGLTGGTPICDDLQDGPFRIDWGYMIGKSRKNATKIKYNYQCPE
jgi:hypothetical protein